MSNHTLDFLDRAMRGDPNALAFLEQTASIYIFDTASDPGRAQVYGCWDFLHHALNEVERYEAQYNARQAPVLVGQQSPGPASLVPHVQMLTSMSRRAARRPMEVDKALVARCLANAVRTNSYSGSPEECQHLIDINMDLRERVLGRIAALAFDFALHVPTSSPGTASAFADPVSMEGLCNIVAANSMSGGPSGLKTLVGEWIVPASAAEKLPRLSSAAVCAHLADEAMGRGAPAGTAAMLEELLEPVLSTVLGPLLADAVRDSDASGGPTMAASVGPTRNQRVAAMSLKALERWCAATGVDIVKLKSICAGGGAKAKVDIIEVISDALYSDAEIVIDAVAELLETLLRKNLEESAAFESVYLVGSFLQGGGSESSVIGATAGSMKLAEEEREKALSELVSAIGLQRFRFSTADPAVCRCLARMASSVALAAQNFIRAGKMGSGLLDFLLKGASHPSINVCGICLESIPRLIAPGSKFSDRLLPVLQQRAIVPTSLRRGSDFGDADCEVDFSNYATFRENLLSVALVACYKNNRGFYMESCAFAINEFCTAQMTPQLPYQLEAALFCLSAVSMDSSKRALLVNASSSAQANAAKASLARGGAETVDIAADAMKHDEELAKCVSSISKNPACATSSALSLAQMCIFIAKFAKWLSKTPSPGSLEAASDLALKAFQHCTSPIFTQDAATDELTKEMSVYPVAEAATALRNILSRSPKFFANPEALSALESGWMSAYASTSAEDGSIAIANRQALCSGLCRVVAALPPDQWTSSLSHLASPTIVCLEAATKQVDALSSNESLTTQKGQILVRMADEIKLLAVMTRTFNNLAAKSDEVDTCAPLNAILRKAWPCLLHVAQHHSSYDIISRSLSDLLTAAVAIKIRVKDDITQFRSISEMAASIMAAVKVGGNDATQAALLQFVQEAVDGYGYMGEIHARGAGAASELDEGIRQILDQLLMLSFQAVQSTSSGMWSQVLEQQKGDHSSERSPQRAVAAQAVSNASPDELAAMFGLLTTCLHRCPLLLFGLGDDSSCLRQAVGASVLAMNEKEVDVARGAMMFLKTLADAAANDDKEMPVMRDVIAEVRPRAVLSAIAGSCGIYPREVLDPAASLTHSLLRQATPDEAESVATAALIQEVFQLGDEARTAVLVVLGRAAQNTASPTKLMEVFGSVWSLHQVDDANAIAGGDAVKLFVQNCHK